MAVPKRKSSHSRSAKRRTHYKANLKTPVKDKKTGEYKLPHFVTQSER